MFTPVRLKNGSEVPTVTFKTTKMNLEFLRKKDQNAFNELVLKCKDPNYEMSGGSKKEVNKIMLIQGGQIHDDVRNIVLSLASDIIPDASVEEKSGCTFKR